MTFIVLSAVMRHGLKAGEQEEEAALTLLGGIPVRDIRAGPQR